MGLIPRAGLPVADTLADFIETRALPGTGIDQRAYRAFLHAIGYLVPEPAPFTVAPTGADAEFATLAGPQLVVPVLNARPTACRTA